MFVSFFTHTTLRRAVRLCNRCLLNGGYGRGEVVCSVANVTVDKVTANNFIVDNVTAVNNTAVDNVTVK